MILNAAFLVSRDKEPDFDSKVKEIGGRYAQLTFKYTGPGRRTTSSTSGSSWSGPSRLFRCSSSTSC